MKCIITGGHLTPALATIDELRSRKNPVTIVFIGRAVAMEGGKSETYEKTEMDRRGIRFLPIMTGRLQRFFTVSSVVSYCKVPIGIFQAFYYCLREKPDLIISFGGYVALPVVLSAAILGIPVITHEQTTCPGLANRIIARIAKKICISFEDTRRFFPGRRVVYTGLPVRKEFYSTVMNLPFLQNPSNLPVIYITGGSTGAVSLNELVFPILSDLTDSYIILHQTGKLSLQKAEKLRASLSPDQRKRYIIREYFDSETVASIMKKTSLAVGRSGANTVMEIALSGTPALLIPLPWSANGEQSSNAQFLEASGSSVSVRQSELTPKVLLSQIGQMVNRKQEYKLKALALSHKIPHDGAMRFADEVLSLI